MYRGHIGILFFGSGSFVMPVVESLANASLLWGVVVTKPKARGRGLKKDMPEIMTWARSRNIEVYTPDDPNSDSFVQKVQTIGPQLFVLCSYGHILRGPLLRIPRYGGINVHPSLLPKYRGAAPIQRVLMNGEEITGVTIIIMDEKVDHGDIIMQRELNIEPDDTYGSLSTRLSYLSATMIVNAVNALVTNTCQPITQHHADRTLAPKIQKEEMAVDWRKRTKDVYNLIRALAPYPGARTSFRGREVKVISALPGDKRYDAGVVHIENRGIYVGTHDGSIIIKKLQPESKSVISSIDFINGYRVKTGEVMG